MALLLEAGRAGDFTWEMCASGLGMVLTTGERKIAEDRRAGGLELRQGGHAACGRWRPFLISNT